MERLKCNWSNVTSEINHIDKHVIKSHFESGKWKRLLDRSFYDYSSLKNEFDRSSDKEFTSLFNYYDYESKDLVQVYNPSYLYRSNEHYSLNFRDDRDEIKKDLTTCTVFNKLRGNETELTILSCFFKNNIIIDSCIFVAAYILYTTPLEKTDSIFTKLEGFTYLYDHNLELALDRACIDDYRVCFTPGQKRLRRYFHLIYDYLKLQFNSLKESSEDIVNIYKSLLNRINMKYGFDNNLYVDGVVPINYIDEQLNQIKNYFSIYEDEIPDSLITEVTLLVFASYNNEYLKELLKYLKTKETLINNVCITLLENI